MAQKVSLESLNKVVPNRTVGKGKKERKVSNKSRNDKIAVALAGCNSAAEVGYLAMKFGITEQEVRARAKGAANFGLFRMVLGNRIRGIANKIGKAAKKNIKLSVTDAAYPKAASKPAVKKTKKVAKKKVAKKTTKK